MSGGVNGGREGDKVCVDGREGLGVGGGSWGLNGRVGAIVVAVVIGGCELYWGVNIAVPELGGHTGGKKDIRTLPLGSEHSNIRWCPSKESIFLTRCRIR